MIIISGKWIDALQTKADLVIDHPVYGHIPYTYDPSDTTGNVTASEVAAHAIVGYTPPSQADIDADKSVEERLWRDSQYNVIQKEINRIEDGHASGRSTLVLWRQYRNKLRDYPQQGDFPNGTRPTVPGGV